MAGPLSNRGRLLPDLQHDMKQATLLKLQLQQLCEPNHQRARIADMCSTLYGEGSPTSGRDPLHLPALHCTCNDLQAGDA